MGLISVTAELDRLLWPYEPSSEDHVKCKCPFHEDDTPSCSLNVREEPYYFSCKAAACAAKGDFISFLVMLVSKQTGTPVTRALVYADLAKRYKLDDGTRPIEPKVVESFHEKIWDHKHLLKELYLRGVTDADIRKHRLGACDSGPQAGRITIPIKNVGGIYVNLKYYLPGAPGHLKMKHSRGRGQVRLFPMEQMDYQDVVLCGGEIKAIVAGRILNPHKIGAVGPTNGEGNWHASLTPYFKDKRVWIMMDIDESGMEAAQKHAQWLRGTASWIGIIQLPLDKDKYPHGDVNDFVATEKGDLYKLLLETPEWFPPTQAPTIDENEEPTPVGFSDSIKSVMVGKRMAVEAVVAAASTEPFIVPRQILPTCDRSQDFCSVCGIFSKPDEKVLNISPESPAVLKFIGVDEAKRDSAIKDALSIPPRCPAVTFEIGSYFDADDVRINPSLDICNRDTDRPMQHAVCIGCSADLNTTYEFAGRLYPHPKTQQAVLVFSKSKTSKDSLSRYEPQRLADLRRFRPVDWTLELLTERLDELYTDLEANVTQIYMRRDMHLFVDLAYHSCLLFEVDGKITKGWTEVIIVGDSSQGKTEVVTTLMRHYGLGEKTECKNASLAGLLGGLRQFGTAWYVSWGILPTQDRMLVHLEELKGASTKIISQLTDARSSGVAEIPKIEKRRTHSRTRIIATSNPRDDRDMSSFAFGVEAIKDVVGAPEDVRRFDAALVVAVADIDARQVNKMVRHPPKVDHEHTSDLCRELILWAWTRRPNQVIISAESSALISEEASKFAEEYSSTIPLVDPGSMRHKLSRLSVALAARTFSTGETEHEVLVRPCHVQYVVNTLRRVYNSRSFGYNTFSEATRATNKLLDPETITSYLENMQHPNELKENLLYTDSFDIVDIHDWTGGVDRDEAQRFVSMLVRKRAVKRVDRRYHKTAEFIEYLKHVRLRDRPDHIKKDEDKF